MSLISRFTNAWNAFQSESDRRNDLYREPTMAYESVSSVRGDRTPRPKTNERTVLNLIFNRIANDVAAIQILHVRTDSEGRYVATINSGLNKCMSLSANIDQTSRDFWIDLVVSMFDEGSVAAVPVETDRSLDSSNAFDVLNLRTGKIVTWMPRHVRIELYNERTGNRETITLPKDKVAILENPFYSLINEPNSTLKRLVHKMDLLDRIDNQRASTKLNMIVKLPYSLYSSKKREQAEARRKDLEEQLVESKYGIAYIDQAEQVTPLSRPLENDLPNQIKALREELYNQIGFSMDVIQGTATKEQMLLYHKKVLKPILDGIELEFTRKFLTPTAYTQGQRVKYFIDMFDMVTPDEVGDMANSLSRNEIMSANELRGVMGLKPNNSERSDQLINKNLPIDQIDPNAQNQNGSPDDLESSLQEIEAMLNDDSDDDNGELSQSELLLEQLKSSLT